MTLRHALVRGRPHSKMHSISRAKETDRAHSLPEPSHPVFTPCLRLWTGLGGLEQTRLYAVMEDQTYVWRSMYVDHLQKWLKVFPPEAMLVVPSEALKQASSFKTVMERFASLLGLPRAGPEVHNELIFKASPASTDGSVHENGRAYIGEIPPDVRNAPRAPLLA